MLIPVINVKDLSILVRRFHHVGFLKKIHLCVFLICSSDWDMTLYTISSFNRNILIFISTRK
jgi:uncharacterized membrane protein YhaH (DUF805 family)